MHKLKLTNNDMKDFNGSSKDSVTLTAIFSPVIILLMVLAGVFISDQTVSAQESPESSRISADLQEDYFTSNSNNHLAQAGDLLESRSESEANATVEVSVDEASSCNNVYLDDHLRIDFDNDRVEVLKLQSFLKTFEGYDNVALSGTFDKATLTAVEAFQTRYAEDVLTPWGYEADEATGYVYITTKQKINEIYCDQQFLLSRSQQTEIREYREKLNNWRAQGASFDTPQYLAEYYGYTAATNNEVTTDNNSNVTVTETPSNTTTATTATTSEDDNGGFFNWLFGNNDDSEEEAATTSTTTETDDDEVAVDTENDDEASDTEGEEATTSTSSVDQMAAGVYTGVNGIIDFLLSPTFLLIVLVILILLLIATLIEKGDEDSDPEAGDDSDNDDDEADETTATSDEESLDSTVAFADITDEDEMVDDSDDEDNDSEEVDNEEESTDTEDNASKNKDRS